jgi:hypothetical protein
MCNITACKGRGSKVIDYWICKSVRATLLT